MILKKFYSVNLITKKFINKVNIYLDLKINSALTKVSNLKINKS